MNSVDLNKKYAEFGLFHACYLIGEQKRGAPQLNLNVVVNTVQHVVHGEGKLFLDQPNQNVYRVNGEYNYLCTMKDCHILMVIEGVPLLKPWPAQAGIGPQLPVTLKARLLLDDTFKKGIAYFQYQDTKGEWHEVSDVPVQMEPCQKLP
ncbi:DUF1842 domain-containing protein [Zooshikella sp. RANM57]|uniref:DUF1842 domain-containing protein n=1 Tax=Zooshikella sp. RANM57 TaxID=3425863 RepID=UPI003D6DE9AB